MDGYDAYGSKAWGSPYSGKTGTTMDTSHLNRYSSLPPCPSRYSKYGPTAGSNPDRNSRFLHRYVKNESSLTIEAVLAGGSIHALYRNTQQRRFLVVGRIDKVFWLVAKSPSEADEDVFDVTIPDGYSVEDVDVWKDFPGGRVILTFPRQETWDVYGRRNYY
eukprot:Platyproteum_vivax@DN92_c0_g1_i1.p1